MAMKNPRPRQYCGVPGCGKSFDRPAKLIAHQRVHNGERPFECTHCHKSFAQNKHLQVHLLHHLDQKDRPYMCNHCSKGYVTKQHLERHLKTHEPAQSYKCAYCERSFIQKKSYDSHTARHRICPDCGKICRNEKELCFHKAKRHSQRFHCSECSLRFDTADELRQHSSEAHLPVKELPPSVAFLVGLDYERRSIGCPYECGRRFRRNYDLKRHIRTAHAESHPEPHSESPST